MRRSPRIAARTLIALGLAVALLQPVGPAVADESNSIWRAASLERSQSKLRFLTLRNYRPGEPAEDRFGGQRSALRAGICHTERAELSWLRDANRVSPIALPDGYSQVVDVELQPQDDFWAALATESALTRPVLYTHGYNESFDRACRRATELMHAIDREARFVLFSWPSDGNPARYTHDEADIGWSEAGLVHAFRLMADRFGKGGFDVFAHSLGSRGVMRAVAAVAPADGTADPIINQLVFIAGDVDIGLFSYLSPHLQRAANRVSAIVNDQDLPLKLSEELHGAPRLGQAGPHLDALDGVDIYDLSDLSMRGSTGHLYHLNHPRVHALLRSLMSNDSPERPDGRRVRIEDAEPN
ncbi:MAG: alpha/beta hydrolase [Pseudomonadota bacterium]